ncbi:condensation domain-containing protein, partial [Xanthomonas sp. 3058]|uniref:condensation domain-containing protein n=1 Tax=Xanthomonas sp. 3058 TaxID=3035314 RepID=UPI00161652F9
MTSSAKFPQDISTLSTEEAHRLWALLSEAGPTGVEEQTIQPRNDGEIVPLSFAQQRLWFLAQFDARAAQAYLLAGGVNLHGVLDLPALQQALDRIVARHEALRTSFVAADDGAIQLIAAPDIGFALQCVDLRQAADPHADAQRHAALETSTP